MTPAVAAENVSRVYGTGPTAVTALAGVTLAVAAGERVAVLGKSGSGKSTLMNLVGGLDVPSSGSLAVAGLQLGTLSRRQLADFRRDQIGFVFQSFHLISGRTVLQNVELPLVLASRGRADRRKLAEATLEAVGLGHRLNHRPGELSGGERQRAAVARAVVNRPAILLADEPTGNLDSASAAAVMELLQNQVKDRGMTLILVTHDENLAARSADRCVRMADGRIAGETRYS